VAPGLGSLAAGKKVGYVQLALYLTGFALTMIFGLQFFTWSMKNWTELHNDDDPNPVESLRKIWAAAQWVVVGIGCFAVSWVWAMQTSRSILKETRTVNSTGTPPVLAVEGYPGWQKNGAVITRTYVFPDFPAALRFVNAVAEHAEQVQHHPDIDIRWNKVTLALTTHDAGGLTDKDYALALVCDRLYAGG